LISILTSRVLLLASIVLILSIFDKARFTFLTQPPHFMAGTLSVTELAAATSAVGVASSVALTDAPKSTANTTIADFNIYFFLC
jgi:hypothetical protein